MDISVVRFTAARRTAEHVFPSEGNGLARRNNLLDVVNLAARLCEEDANPLITIPIGLVGGSAPAPRVPKAHRKGVGHNIVVSYAPFNVIFNAPITIILNIKKYK